MSKAITVHMISFNVPYPANYGGVIDVFYQIKALSKLNVQVILHCFEYGRSQAPELNQYCKQVYYYKRKTGLLSQFSMLPYIVNSRRSKALENNLLKDNYPILFQGTHCCFLLNNSTLRNRLKLLRVHNIEWNYYLSLYKQEKNWIKKLYFKLSYALYHGDLSVKDNENAALFLIEKVFQKLELKLVIAGLNPGPRLLEKVKQKHNIEIKANLTNKEMNSMIQNAHINILVSFNSAGMKLKLLNALYKGRHCIVNSPIILNTGLESLCHIHDNHIEITQKIKELTSEQFSSSEIEKRKKLLISSSFSNVTNARKTLDILDNYFTNCKS